MTKTILCFLTFLMLPILAFAQQAEQGQLCRAAIRAAETAAGIPAHLLMAIGRVESGRRDPVSGAFHPWPWTINAEGRGSFFPDRAAAIAAVRSLQAQGVRSIDIGCMQINLRHHPNAFSSLEEAFDPATNARYAARFLTELRTELGDWNRASAAYHSRNPEYANAYQARVAQVWAEEQRSPANVTPAMLAALGARPPASGGGAAAGAAAGATLSNGAARAQVIAAPSGTQGRGLDAYRAMPILQAPMASVPRGGLIIARRF